VGGEHQHQRPDACRPQRAARLEAIEEAASRQGGSRRRDSRSLSTGRRDRQRRHPRRASSRARLSSRPVLTSASITSTRTTRDYAASDVKTMSTADRRADVKTHIVLSRPVHHRSRTIG
jgi:hypothetical protein